METSNLRLVTQGADVAAPQEKETDGISSDSPGPLVVTDEESTVPADAAAPTPRTDALIKNHTDCCGLNALANFYNDLLDHARTLERELAAAKEELARVKELARAVVDHPHAWSLEALRAAVKEK
jgi:hypothetical protein